jgi:hypothetical protein
MHQRAAILCDEGNEVACSVKLNPKWRLPEARWRQCDRQIDTQLTRRIRLVSILIDMLVLRCEYCPWPEACDHMRQPGE